MWHTRALQAYQGLSGVRSNLIAYLENCHIIFIHFFTKALQNLKLNFVNPAELNIVTYRLPKRFSGVRSNLFGAKNSCQKEYSHRNKDFDWGQIHSDNFLHLGFTLKLQVSPEQTNCQCWFSEKEAKSAHKVPTKYLISRNITHHLARQNGRKVKSSNRI